jgi:hypothetical protein
MTDEVVESSETRRKLQERLDELVRGDGREGAKPRPKEAQFLRMQLGVLDLFSRVDQELGSKAKLEVIRHGAPAPEISVRLSPTNPGAARIEAHLDPEDTVYLGLGIAGWMEMWIGSTGVEEFLNMLEEDVRAVVRGDLEEVYWRPEGESEQDVKGSKTYLTLQGKRRRVGKIGVWRPARKVAKVHRIYEPY